MRATRANPLQHLPFWRLRRSLKWSRGCHEMMITNKSLLFLHEGLCIGHLDRQKSYLHLSLSSFSFASSVDEVKTFNCREVIFWLFSLVAYFPDSKPLGSAERRGEASLSHHGVASSLILLSMKKSVIGRFAHTQRSYLGRRVSTSVQGLYRTAYS